MSSSAGLPQTPPQRPPLRRGVKEGIIALAALPLLLATGVYLGDRISDDGPSALEPAAPVAGAPRTPTPVVTVRPATPRPVVTVKPATPAPVATVKAATPAPQVTVRQSARPAGPSAPAPVVTVQPPTPAPVATVRPPAPRTSPPAPGPATPPPSAPGAAALPPVPAELLARGASGPDVLAWQRQMAARGWRIQVDGRFGPQTERIATRFQRNKGLRVDGIVGRETWAAAWRLPVRG